MKFQWELIWDNNEIKIAQYFEATYRAKIFGGWLIRHETCCDYQYQNHGCDNNDYAAKDLYVDEEGYQKIKNTISFIPDSNHEWEVD